MPRTKLAARSSVAMIVACALQTPAASEPDTAAASPTATAARRAELSQGDIRTRHAFFKGSSFAELPGWGQDDLDSAWPAFEASCQALSKRDDWRGLCAKAGLVRREPAARRHFFESEFALFRILNADASTDGDVTGYYEPLIGGSLRTEGAHRYPVYGTPRDLLTLDWMTIPEGQRRGVIFVVRSGSRLVVVGAREAGSFALDTGQFDFDSRDRTWRIQLSGGRALPYLSRAEIESGSTLDAPVLAYVDDPLALYAMQVQGSGRIRLRDGKELRLQYAEQNGQPFRPVRLAPKTADRVRTRGIALEADDVERFELAPDAPDAAAGAEPPAGVATRGLKRNTPATPNNRAADALVEQLLRDARGKPSAPVPATPTVTPPAASAPTTINANVPGAPRAGTLVGDPSYVFFRVAADQSPARGPQGALGVPLTAGRSIAVDPRVTPLGYPVYMSSGTNAGAAAPLQRLVIAQDTGGAIRGAIRADFFWGSGPDAGRQAMRTRQRGEMWLMVPASQVWKLLETRATTRGVSTRSAAPRGDAECLVADDAFCVEP